MRNFGVEEANRLVPLLTQLFERVRPWVDKAQKLASELEPLQAQGTRDAHTERLREEYEALTWTVSFELRTSPLGSSKPLSSADAGETRSADVARTAARAVRLRRIPAG